MILSCKVLYQKISIGSSTLMMKKTIKLNHLILLFQILLPIQFHFIPTWNLLILSQSMTRNLIERILSNSNLERIKVSNFSFLMEDGFVQVARTTTSKGERNVIDVIKSKQRTTLMGNQSIYFETKSPKINKKQHLSFQTCHSQNNQVSCQIIALLKNNLICKKGKSKRVKAR